MSPQELIAQCDLQISISPEYAKVALKMKGNWGKSRARRLWPGGPRGEVVAQRAVGELVVMFDAYEVRKAVEVKLGQVQKEADARSLWRLNEPSNAFHGQIYDGLTIEGNLLLWRRGTASTHPCAGGPVGHPMFDRFERVEETETP